MTTGSITLPGPVSLHYSGRAVEQLDHRPSEFIAEVNQLAHAGALPVTIDVAPDAPRLALHTRRHVAWLYLTKAQDGYRVGHATRRRFRDEERLLKRALLMTSRFGFVPYHDLASFAEAGRQLGHPRPSYWSELLGAWTNLESGVAPAAGLPPAHEQFLDLTSRLVQAERQIEIEKQSAAAPMHYVRRTTAKEQRFSARGVYTFQLARQTDCSTNRLVYVDDRPDLRGRVIRIDDLDVTVRFEPGVDFQQLKPQGMLRMLPSDRVFRAQQDAITMLRRREARNPALLNNLVDASFAGYQPASDVQPEVALDRDQLSALQRSVAVPDLMTVLGPPGTGKTTTIREMVLACAARGQRVLVAAHTNRALDNVLEKLPGRLRTVRVGNEDSMSAGVLALTSDSQVEGVRRQILAETALLDRLTEFERGRPLLEGQLAHLTGRLDDADSGRQRLAAAEGALADAIRQACPDLRPGLDQAEQAVVTARAALAREERALARLHTSVQRADDRAAGNATFAFVFRWWAQRRSAQLTGCEAAVAARATSAADAGARSAALWAQAAQASATDPDVRRLAPIRDQSRAAVADAWGDVGRAADLICGMLRPVLAVPRDRPANAGGWQAFAGWAAEALGMLGRRAELLREWRAQVGDVSVDLQREIVRYADVVGATCVGTATSELLADLDFDVAIIDEAGQISMPNLLVPLVRARRAVLVGDHHQLPPFLDDDVRTWARSLRADEDLDQPAIAQISTMLHRSGFEQVFPRAGKDNAVRLTVQRRMPQALAGFVSAAFYGRGLRTEHPGERPDLLFRAPFAMVDTSDRIPAERAETPGGGPRGNGYGYTNELEADLIAELVSLYRRHYRSWAVIVPFNAQKDLLIERLAATLGTAQAVDGNVGTVDSFQGGERDLIIFGCTRSNPGGDIGFLKELRRFNVAITRARQQLVVVGDAETLRRSVNPAFRTLMRSMLDHLARHGDLRSSGDVVKALAAPGTRP